MIVVIQCAATKRPEAGFMMTADGRPVSLVADPSAAPSVEGIAARPDDPTEDGSTWRDILVRYNERPGDNPLGLLPAAELYLNPVYRALRERFGAGSTYILSAGWGLIRSDFLTPSYDITFSGQADPYKRRRKGDAYRDFRMLPDDADGPVVFLGGKDYIPLFLDLTGTSRGDRIVVSRSAAPPRVPGCSVVRFETRTCTNWHYEAAAALLRGDFAV